MRSILTVVVALLAVALLTGMGSLGGTPEGTVPKADENIHAQIVDRLGVKTDVTWLSMDGKASLEGKRGAGKMTVPFHDLKEVSFGPVSGDEVSADLLLKSGGHHEVGVAKSLLFYGDTGYGVFRISAGEVSRIVIHPGRKR